MELPLDDPWLSGLANVVVFGSVATWIYLVARWLRTGSLLAWEPRWPVPWGPPAAILAIAFALLAVSSGLTPTGAVAASAEPSARQAALSIVVLMASQLLLAGGFFFVISVFYQATRQDLGLARSTREAMRDVVVGGVACFAALVPVRIVQGLLLGLMGRGEEMSQHPLIETLTKNDGASWAVMLLACISAVVVAPICEEVTFRLLLQGWLEKWEDAKLGRTPNAAQSPTVVSPPTILIRIRVTKQE